MSIKNNQNQARIASAIPVSVPVDLNENQSENKKSAARARLRLAIPKMQQADLHQQQQHQQLQLQQNIPRNTEVNAKLLQSEPNENSDYLTRLTSDDSCSSGSGSAVENSRYFNLHDGNRFMFIDEGNDFGNELSNRGKTSICYTHNILRFSCYVPILPYRFTLMTIYYVTETFECDQR